MNGRTLVVLAHPDLENSRITAALAAVANRAPGVEVRDLSALYPDRVIDVAAEQAALAHVDEVVLQYPTYWYSMPGLLKQWLDDVLVRGWAYGTGRPGALRGVGLRVVTSTGGVEEEYATGGFHGWPYDDILVPLEATARRLGMLWREPLVVHGAREVTEAELAAAGHRYCELLGHSMTVAA
jgi:putative NADPH-quinone reductase